MPFRFSRSRRVGAAVAAVAVATGAVVGLSYTSGAVPRAAVATGASCASPVLTAGAWKITCTLPVPTPTSTTLVTRTRTVTATATPPAPTSSSTAPAPTTSSAAPTPVPTGPQAAAADTFVDSVGVNVHLSYGDTTYGNYALVKQRLIEAGIRRIRDYPTPANVDKIVDLGKAGVRLDAVMGVATPRPWFPITFEQLYTAVSGPLLPYVVTVEGANEWDLNGTQPTGWTNEIRDYQGKLWKAMKGNPATAGIPVLGPSMGAAYNDDAYNKLGSLTGVVDACASHPYSGGIELSAQRVTEQLAREAKMCGSKPVYITETGYHTSQAAVDQLHPAVNPVDTGKYIPREYLEAFRRGIPATYVYELVDEHNDPAHMESNFGLLDADFAPKPAFTATKNMIALLADKGASFQPGRLDYALAGGDDSTRQVLLQKRDGTFWLAVWQDTRVLDVSGGRFTELDPPDKALTITLASTRDITTFMPNRGTAALTTTRSNTAAVNSSEEVTLIQIK